MVHSSGTVTPIRVTARSNSSDRLMSDTVESSVETVTETPARWRRGVRGPS